MLEWQAGRVAGWLAGWESWWVAALVAVASAEVLLVRFSALARSSKQVKGPNELYCTQRVLLVKLQRKALG